MAITLTNDARSAAADAVVDLLDAGDSNGYIALEESDGTELCVLDLDDPAFGAASNGVATASTIAQGTVTAAGTIERARFFDSNDNEVFRCTVGTSGEDINLSSVEVEENDIVAISSLTYTQPASAS